MKQRVVIIAMAVLICLTSSTFAQAPEGLSQSQLNSLAVVKHKVNGVQELANAGVITAKQAEEATNKYLAEANTISGRQITLQELSNVPDGVAASEPTWLSRAAERVAGWMTFGNIMLGFAAIIGAIAVIIFCFQFIADFLTSIPVVVYEVVIYAVAVALIGFGKTWSPDYGHFIALFGSLIAAGGVILSFKYHGPKDAEFNSPLYFGILTAIFGGTALYYQSSLIGVFASVALMGTLGFSAAVSPFCYAIGFNNKDSIARATVASFFILFLFVVVHFANVSLPTIAIFEPGLMFMGSFVGYLGLLIISSRFYPSAEYVTRQILTIALGIAALFFGSILGLPILLKVGGTFFALYLLEKLLDIISALEIRSAYAISAIGIIVAGLLAGGGMLIVRNQEFLSKYLLFI